MALDLTRRLLRVGTDNIRVAGPVLSGLQSRHTFATDSTFLATGGRSTNSGFQATVFGATGFLGRYVVHELGKVGTKVVVPFRCQENKMMHLKVMGDLGQIIPQRMSIRDPAAIRAAVAGSDVVINLVGEEKESWNWSFQDLHVTFPRDLAIACRDAGVGSFIQVSCLGASENAPSDRLKSKWEGERVVQSILPHAMVAQLAPVVGNEDMFYNRIARFVQNAPRVAIVDGGHQLVQPVWVQDVNAGIRAMLQQGTPGATYEMAGPHTYTLKEVVGMVQESMREPKKEVIPVPGVVVGEVSGAVMDFLVNNKLPSYFINPWFTRDGVKESGVDLVRSEGSLGLESFGITPSDVSVGRPMEHVRFYRRGGYHFGATELDG